MELTRKLMLRHENDNPIRVGVIGCGQMGSGLVHSVSNIKGMSVRAIADIDPKRGIEAFLSLGFTEDAVTVTDRKNEAEDALRKGRRVVSEDALLLAGLDGVDANVDATGMPSTGAMVAWNSIMNRKPIIMLNVETDITVGVLLNDLARRMGTVYTVASGDEPGVCKMLYEQAVLMGFEVVCLGKGKNNVIDYSATPETCREEAAGKDMNPKMLAAFKDGTKTMVEMAAVSNATGLMPDVPGMHGVKKELNELVSVFIPKEHGGIFSGKGRVDFSTGKIAPGVFAVVYAKDHRIRKDMKFITGSGGPYYLHFRPYHLCDLETPQSIAEAVLLGEVTVVSERLNSDVVCVAKRNLKAGEKVKGIGYEDFYGRILRAEEARKEKTVPIGIAEGGTVLEDIQKGAYFTEDSFRPDETALICRLRRTQDALPGLGGGRQS